jgi:ferredoxin/coenzyme F420-reducing hydrogenase delta subunit
VGALYQWFEVALDRVVSSHLNPLYHTGTIAVFSLAVATVTGVYLFLFYRVGTGAAHQSIEAIVRHPLGIGSLVRSLHRYASDAAIVAAALHGVKMLLNDRFWGARWLSWVTGIVLVALVWVTGATGYWLVWDMQAQVLSMTTARFVDVLPFFTEPIVQTFLQNDRVQNFLFFIVLFVHITIPLLLGLFYWLHVMRLARARFFPPRVVLWVTGAALLIASLVRPALSGPPADPALLPGVIPVDWFYFGCFPLTRLDPRAGWAIVAGSGLAAFLLPWVLRGREPARAKVESVACTGCTRCYKDCPYDAIIMIPRTGGGRYKTEAIVNPARCVGCGICVGACDSGGILLGGQPARVLTSAVAARLATARRGRLPEEARDAGQRQRALPDASVDALRPVLVYACRLMPHLEGLLDDEGALRDVPAAIVMGLPCVGMLHPDMLGDALAAGAAGVYIAGCVPEDCQFREGSDWLAERLSGARLPKLKGAPAERVRLAHYSPVEVGRFIKELTAFVRELPA